jgi:acetolactate synthase I/II/III large subunit
LAPVTIKVPAGTPQTGGHAVVEALRRCGTTAIFAIHGVQIEPIFQACLDLDVELVDVRHEASAGFAAEAYARVGGGLGAAAVCPGPGMTNVLTSIANARVDRTPVIYIVGSTPGSTLESNGLQVGLDHVALAAPVTKWACRIHSADHLDRLVAQAIRVAMTVPQGPVLLDIPADVLAGPRPAPIECATLVEPAAPSAQTIDTCLDALGSAARPAILLGHTLSGPARLAAAQLVASTGIPCFAGYGALGTVADDDERHGGTLYQLARLPVDQRPDVAVAIGVQFGFDTPGLRDGGVQWGTALLHIDGDPAEIARFGAARLGAVADPDTALAALAVASRTRRWNVSPGWRASVRNALDSGRAELDAIPVSDGSRLHPYAAARVATGLATEHGAVIVGDGAVCKHWLHDALRLPAGGRYLTHGRLGCMGMGLGLAIGACYASGRRPVVCVTGDGALGFSIGEFEAIVRHRLPIVTVVMNNARWGASQGFQLRPGGPGRVVGTTLSDADYHDVMVAFGGQGRRVNTIEDLRSALEGALRSGGPACINVSTYDAGRPPELQHLSG